MLLSAGKAAVMDLISFSHLPVIIDNCRTMQFLVILLLLTTRKCLAGCTRPMVVTSLPSTPPEKIFAKICGSLSSLVCHFTPQSGSLCSPLQVDEVLTGL